MTINGDITRGSAVNTTAEMRLWELEYDVVKAKAEALHWRNRYRRVVRAIRVIHAANGERR